MPHDAIAPFASSADEPEEYVPLKPGPDPIRGLSAEEPEDHSSRLPDPDARVSSRRGAEEYIPMKPYPNTRGLSGDQEARSATTSVSVNRGLSDAEEDLG